MPTSASRELLTPVTLVLGLGIVGPLAAFVVLKAKGVFAPKWEAFLLGLAIGCFSVTGGAYAPVYWIPLLGAYLVYALRSKASAKTTGACIAIHILTSFAVIAAILALVAPPSP